MITFLLKLRRTGILTVAGLYRLLEALATTGANPMAMLRVSAKLHPHRLAVADESERATFLKLWRQSEVLAQCLAGEYRLQRGMKVAMACQNHLAAVKVIFALSRLGVHLYLINPEMTAQQLYQLDERLHFDFYFYDDPLASVFADSPWRKKSLPSYHPRDISIDQLAKGEFDKHVRIRKAKAGNIVVMTGGTTGQPKAATRRPSVLDFLPPFMALLTDLDLDRCRSVYIATPVYHGFGLAALFMGVMLGTEMHLTRRFQAKNACELIDKEQIQGVTVVPLMLQRMLQYDPALLKSLQRIMTGGAMLSPALATESLAKLGPTLFNMYGTSEGGFAVLARPELLARKPTSIGRPVSGVRARIVNESEQEVQRGSVGRLCLRSSWTVNKKQWIETGDLAYRDEEGDLFLCGRIDDMIVSGGENVYPIELENLLVQHPDIAAVAVVGIPDPEFGQRLKAVVVLKEGRQVDGTALLAWLKPRAARHQMPAIVDFLSELPHTPLGKVDKKALRRT